MRPADAWTDHKPDLTMPSFPKTHLLDVNRQRYIIGGPVKELNALFSRSRGCLLDAAAKDPLPLRPGRDERIVDFSAKPGFLRPRGTLRSVGEATDQRAAIPSQKDGAAAAGIAVIAPEEI